MTAVQLVLDKPLLRDIDRHAKKLSISRSEFVRSAMREALNRIEYLEQIEVERRAYERSPPTPSERTTHRLLSARSERAALADGDDW